jgi:hypothetical protein
MSIKLVNNNYEIIVASNTDNLYIKVTNLINYSSYESTILSYDIYIECVKTLKNLWNIIVKAFEMMNKYEVNILNPNIETLDNDYVILKLLEQNNNIVLTIYYNLSISFEFNITLNKIISEDSICDLTKIKYDLKSKDKRIDELQNKVDKLENKLNYVLDYLYKNKIDSTVIFLNSIKDIDISIYINLNKLIVGSHDQKPRRNSGLTYWSVDYSNNRAINKLIIDDTICDNTYIPISNTLEILIIIGSPCFIDGGICRPGNMGLCGGIFELINILQLPKLRYLEFINCRMLCDYDINLLDQLKIHPNKTNIRLKFGFPNYFEKTIVQYQSIGLLSVSVN